jgi:hypothetical protein
MTTNDSTAVNHKFNPSTLNPLRQSNPEDTMLAVSSILGFIQSAIIAMGEQDASEYDLGEKEIGTGLFNILETCRTALDYVPAEEGGVA